jgi:hypothetical protein
MKKFLFVVAVLACSSMQMDAKAKATRIVNKANVSITIQPPVQGNIILKTNEFFTVTEQLPVTYNLKANTSRVWGNSPRTIRLEKQGDYNIKSQTNIDQETYLVIESPR